MVEIKKRSQSSSTSLNSSRQSKVLSQWMMRHTCHIILIHKQYHSIPAVRSIKRSPTPAFSLSSRTSPMWPSPRLSDMLPYYSRAAAAPPKGRPLPSPCYTSYTLCLSQYLKNNRGIALLATPFLTLGGLVVGLVGFPSLEMATISIILEPTTLVLCRGKRRCRSLYWRVRAEIRRQVKGRSRTRFSFQYDPFSYALNFDDGGSGFLYWMRERERNWWNVLSVIVIENDQWW